MDEDMNAQSDVPMQGGSEPQVGDAQGAPQDAEPIGQDPQATHDNNDEHGKIPAILAYLLVGIIWYFADDKVKSSTLAKFHVKQAINLMVVSIVAQTVLSMLMSGMYMLSPLLAMLSMLVNLAVLVLWVMGLISAVKAEQKEIPLIGGLAAKYLKF